MNTTFRLAWRNIWRQPRRTWLTVSAIAFAVFLLVFTIPVQMGAYDIMIDYSVRVFHGHAQIQRPGYQDRPQIRNAITGVHDLAESLRRSGEFGAVAVRASGFALASSETRSYAAQVVGVEPQYEPGASTIPGLVKQGRFLSGNNALEAVIGSALARNLKAKPGDELVLLGSGKDGSVAATIVSVAGVFESGSQDMDRYFVEIPLGTFQDVFSMGDSAHSIVVVGEPLKKQPQLMQALHAHLPADSDLAVLGWQQLMPGLMEGIQVDKVSGFVFMGLLVLVVVFSIFNTFVMSVLERTKEFGLMLALGARPARIAKLVMLETFLLTAVGLAIGASIGWAVTLYLHSYGFAYPGMKELSAQYNLPIDRIYPQVSLYTFTFGPAVILLVTNLVAWIPVLRIRRLQPVEAMRTI